MASRLTILWTMTSTDRPRIALWTADPDTLGNWRSELQSSAYELVDSLPGPDSLEPRALAAAVRELGLLLICTDDSQIERQLAQREGRGKVESLGLIVVDRALATTEQAEPLSYEYRSGKLTRLRLPAGAPTGSLQLACQLLIDIVQLRRQIDDAGRTHQDLARQALIDPLTGLPNRRAWDDELARRMTVAAATGGSLMLAIFDLDCFKAVNDERGHDVGDATLRLAARRLRTALRDRDFLARLGGDEFGLLVSGVERETAVRIVERARASLAQIAADDDCPAPQASAGVAVRGEQSQLTAQQLFQSADQALLAAKRSGRGRTVTADD